MRHPFIVLAAFGLALACESGPAGAPASPPAPASPQPASAREPAVTKSYGGAFEAVPEVALSTILANPAEYADKTVITEGKVQRACSRKGCWMEIGEGADACRVTFKDYAFFVPTNSAGARARLQGRIETSQVEREAVEHLESEGARFHSKGKDGTATEVRMVASAVQLTR